MTGRGPGRRSSPARRALALLLLMAWGAAGIARAAKTSDAKRAELRGKLERTLERLSADLEGASGFAMRDLTTGETFARNADAAFPAASTIKLPILLELFRQAEEGRLDLDRAVAIDPAARVEGGGVLERWSEPYPVLSARHLAVLMMDFSDNYATNLIIDLVGPDSVSARLKAWGLEATLLRRRMMDLAAARAGRENVTTPRDMVGLLERLHAGTILDERHTREALGIMKRNAGTPIRRALPPGVEAADKEGDLDGVRCDSGIVFVPAPSAAGEGAPRQAAVRPFAISVMTAYLKDDAAGDAYITAVTRAAYDYFSTLARSSEYGRRIGP